MYNQLYGTDYTVESVGIEVTRRKRVTTRPTTGVTDKYFAYHLRTGEIFKPDVVHAEEKRKELKALKNKA